MPIRTSNKETCMLKLIFVVMNGLHGYQCYCLHLIKMLSRRHDEIIRGVLKIGSVSILVMAIMTMNKLNLNEVRTVPSIIMLLFCYSLLPKHA